jgi:hypothetical protein
MKDEIEDAVNSYIKIGYTYDQAIKLAEQAVIYREEENVNISAEESCNCLLNAMNKLSQ